MISLTAIAATTLAIVLAGDAFLSIRPPLFIRRCLDGVKFPRDWWWALIGVKLLAAIGLLGGVILENYSFTAAAAAGVVVYFIFAAAAHIRARFVGTEFWLNCLGMLIFSSIVAVMQFCAAML